jgi:hypothetical protein
MHRPLAPYLPGNFGKLDLGSLMVRALRSARELALARRFDNPGTAKHTAGRLDDVVTVSDTEGQAEVIRILRVAMPHVGVVAEEDGGDYPCSLPEEAGVYKWTVDIWGGSKLLEKSGLVKNIAGEISLIRVSPNGTYEVIAVAVIALDNGDVYRFDPWSGGICLDPNDIRQSIVRLPGPPVARGLQKCHIIVRDNPRLVDGPLGMLLDDYRFGGVTRKVSSFPGSVPYSLMFMMHGDATCLVLPRRSSLNQVWDHAPMAGLLRAMDMVPVSVGAAGRLVMGPVEPQQLEGFERNCTVIWCPNALLVELAEFTMAHTGSLRPKPVHP